MGRQASFMGTSKAVLAATAQTITFTPTDVESAGVIAYLFSWSGAGNANVDIDRVRIRAGSDTMVDVSWNQLQAYQQAYAWTNIPNLDAATTFQIPLHFMDAPMRDQQDLCQFPPNREVQIEIVTLNTTVAGSLTAGWVRSDIQPTTWMRYYSNVLNIAASVFNGKYPFIEEGKLRGVTLPAAGVAKAELYVSDKLAWRLPGTQFGGATTGDLLTEMDFFDDGPTVTATKHHKVNLNIPALSPSWINLDTGAAWAGVTNAGAFYAIVDLPQSTRT